MEDISKQIIANLTEYYKNFKGSSEVDFIKTENLYFTKFSDKSGFSIALNKNDNITNFIKTVNEIEQFKIKFNHSVYWILSEGQTKKNIENLRSKRFMPVKKWTNMHAELKEQIKIPKIKNLNIKKISSNADLKIWLKTHQETEKYSNFNLKTISALSNKKYISFYLGKIKDIPVATSLSLEHNSYVGLYLITVKKEFRKLGIGSAITLHPMADAQKTGINNFVLHSSKAGEKLYLKIGFKNYDKMYIFTQNSDS